MKKLIPFLISALFFCFALADTPTIQALSASNSARIMGTFPIEVVANGNGRSLLYDYSLVTNPTGYVKVTNTVGGRATIEVWKDPSNENRGLNQVITVGITVSFSDATANDMSAARTVSVPITSVNHPPVPVVGGDLGTPDAPKVSGQVIQANAFQSNDGDGGTNFRAEWGLGAKQGGRYATGPVLFGTEGMIVAFTIPEMNAPIQQDIRLTVIDGLYAVSQDKTAYLAPTAPEPTPEPEPTPNVPTIFVNSAGGDVCELPQTLVDAQVNAGVFTKVLVPVAPPEYRYSSDMTLDQLEDQFDCLNVGNPTPEPEPEPTPQPTLSNQCLLPVRVIAGFDTGLFVGAVEDGTAVSVEIFENGESLGSKDFSLDKYHTLFYNVHGDLKFNSGELAVISANKPIVCNSVFVSPEGFNRSIAVF